MLEKADALIFAPLPPPVGGVASIVAMLHQSLGNKDNVVFASPIEKGSDFLAVVTRPLHNGIKLFNCITPLVLDIDQCMSTKISSEISCSTQPIKTGNFSKI